jgi:hypothetical protein
LKKQHCLLAVGETWCVRHVLADVTDRSPWHDDLDGVCDYGPFQTLLYRDEDFCVDARVVGIPAAPGLGDGPYNNGIGTVRQLFQTHLEHQGLCNSC